MNKQPHLPTPDESRRHYHVPEGYFDDLEARIMAHLPEEAPAEEPAAPSVSLWTRLRPIAYLAAMFVSMNLIFRAFSPHSSQVKTAATAEVHATTEDDYATYYADYGERMTAVAGYDSYYDKLLSDLTPSTR